MKFQSTRMKISHEIQFTLEVFHRNWFKHLLIKCGDNMQNVESFYNELTPVLEKIKGNPDTFLEGTDVSKVTLWRWINGINRNYPDPHKLLTLLSKISGKRKPQEVFEFFGGKIGEFLKSRLPHLLIEDLEIHPDQSQNGIFKDFKSFIIYILCETESGSTLDEISLAIAKLAFRNLGFSQPNFSEEMKRIYYGMAEEGIKDFEQMGILELRDNGRYHTINKDIIFSGETMMRFYPELIRNFTAPKNVNEYTGLFGYQQSIPAELAEEIKRETKEFFLNKLKKMRENKCNDGVPFQIITFSNNLI